MICILGLMAAVALPNISRVFSRNDADTTIKWICLNTERFRKQAVALGDTLSLCYDAQAHAFCIKGEGTLACYELPPDLQLDAIRVEGDSKALPCIRFSPRGYADAATLEFSGAQVFSLAMEPFLPRVKVLRGEHGGN